MSKSEHSRECEAVEAELGAYVDGELAAQEQTAVEHHLEACAACSEELALLRLVTGSLARAPRPKPSEALRQRLLARVAADLPPHRLTLISMQRHGDQVLQWREVRLTREPALLPPAPPAGPAVGLIVQTYRQEAGYQACCYQLVERSTGRNNHE
jgi:anti-sigma factor RsiW